MAASAPDTIAALATARGQAALAIIRVSGPEAVARVAACFGGNALEKAPSHTAHVGFFKGVGGHVLDQVVVTLFRTPRSATGEDVVEISCHGGDFAPQLILRTLLQGGVRLAAPGEFTQRAFLNGKLDLAQAEAVADLIHAQSALAHRVSVHQLQGRYSQVLSEIRAQMLELCALVELELDFAEEDVAFADKQRLTQLLAQTETLLGGLLKTYPIGERVRDGVRVVIGGRPNAGKSTLLNALVGRDRAIVSPVPGTTRDEIEAEAEIEGLRFIFVDTAGLRQTADAIEAEGVRRAEQAIVRADVLLYVFDLATGLHADEVAFLHTVQTQQAHLPVLLVGNKLDLLETDLPSQVAGLPFLALSAQAGLERTEPLEALVAALVEATGVDLATAEASPVVTNQRHQQHLAQALAAVHRAQHAMGYAYAGDTLALDLRNVLEELGAITGEITNEDVLDQIFSRFCIGK